MKRLLGLKKKGRESVSPQYNDDYIACCLRSEGVSEELVMALVLGKKCNVDFLLDAQSKMPDFLAGVAGVRRVDPKSIEQIKRTLLKLGIRGIDLEAPDLVIIPIPAGLEENPSALAASSVSSSSNSNTMVFADMDELLSASARVNATPSSPTAERKLQLPMDPLTSADERSSTLESRDSVGIETGTETMTACLGNTPASAAQDVHRKSVDYGNLGEHQRISHILKEFPMALERYLSENEGQLPAMPVLTTSPSTLPIVGTDAIDSVSFICSTPQTAENTTIWDLVSNALCFTQLDLFGDGGTLPRNGPGLGSIEETIGTPADEALGTGPVRRGVADRRRNGATSLSRRAGSGASEKASSVLQCRPVSWNGDRDVVAAHYVSEARRLFRIFTGLTPVEGLVFNWVLRSTKGNITVHSSDVPDSTWQATKTDCIIKASKHRICQLITDDTRTCEYDDGVDGYEMLQRVDPQTAIRHYKFKPIWPTAPRDAAMVTTWEELENGSILISTVSMPDDYCPPVQNFVRLKLLSSGALLRPIDEKHGGGTAVTFITHADLGGSVPSFIINMLGTGAPIKNMTNVQRICEKEELEDR